MPKILEFPDGSATRIHVMVRVYKTDTGVGCSDNGGEQIAFIRVRDPDKKKLTLDYLKGCLAAGKQFDQPDWSYLDEEDVIEEEPDNEV